MRIEMDQVWATRSTLHARVIVWGKDDAWRHKHYVALPLSEIPAEALQMLMDQDADRPATAAEADVPLF